MIESSISMILWSKEMCEESHDPGADIWSSSQSFVCLLAY